MRKCPYCNYVNKFKVLKTWKFRFYNVERLECPNCNGVFNYYSGISPRGKKSEFVIKVKPKIMTMTK